MERHITKTRSDPETPYVTCAAEEPTRSTPRGQRLLTGKFRLDRGPLRWWLVLTGILTVQIEPHRFAGGVVLVVAGAVLHLISKGFLHQIKSFRPVITMTGPYRFTRNPFYLGNLVAESGLLLIIGRWWVAALYLLAWALVYHRQITQEETLLARLASETCSVYRRRVPRLFPVPWRYLRRDEVSGAGFSWRNPNISSGAEIERTLRLVSYPLLLMFASVAWKQGVEVLRSPDSTALLSLAGFALLNLLGRSSSLILRNKERRRRIMARDAARSTPHDLPVARSNNVAA